MAMLDNIFGTDVPLGVRLLIVVLVVFAVIGGIAYFFRSKKLGINVSPPSPPTEIAHITEHVAFSGGGRFAVAMLILFNIVLTIQYFAEATNVLQQNVALLSWIGWNILWGIGAIIGRRRMYTVHRDVSREKT